MATPGYLNTPRGQVDKYIYHRSDSAVNAPRRPDYIFNAAATGQESESHLDGVTQVILNAYIAADFWTTGGNVLTYNPITDRYDIKPGEYVL